MTTPLSAPARIYFLAALTKSGDLITVSREGEEYVLRGGFGVHRLLVAATSPKRLDAHLAGYVAGTESAMATTQIDWSL